MSSSNEDTDKEAENKVLYAKVKFRGHFENAVKIVKVCDIKEFKDKLPQESIEFDKTKLYNLRLTDDKKNSKPVYIPIQISEISYNKQNLEKKRTHFLALSPSIVNEYYEQEDSITEDGSKTLVMSDKIEEKLSSSKTDIEKKIDLLLNSANPVVRIEDSFKTYESYENKIKKLEYQIEKLSEDLKIEKENNMRLINENNVLQSKIQVVESINEKLIKSIGTEPQHKTVESQYNSPFNNSSISTHSTPTKSYGVTNISFEDGSKIRKIKQNVDNIQRNDSDSYNSRIISPIRNAGDIGDGDFSDPSNLHMISPIENVKNIDDRFLSDLSRIQQNKKTKEGKVPIKRKQTSDDKHQKKSKKSKKNKTKLKKKKKNQKALNSDEDYESDFYKDYKSKKPLTKWAPDDNPSESYMHLYYDVSIPNEAYKEIKSEIKPTLALRKLTKAIWGSDVLLTKAVRPSKTSMNLDGDERTPLTPRKKAALRKYYFKYLDDKVTVEKVKRKLKLSWKKDVGALINDLIQREKRTKNCDDTSNSSSSSDSSSENESSTSTD